MLHQQMHIQRNVRYKSLRYLYTLLDSTHCNTLQGIKCLKFLWYKHMWDFSFKNLYRIGSSFGSENSENDVCMHTTMYIHHKQ